MIPVTQTILGRGPEFKEPCGNCFAACIASILGISLDGVPNFCAGDDWYGAVNTWLAKRGLRYAEMQIDDRIGDWFLDNLGYCVVSGLGPRGCQHSVVGYRGAVVHDPHPKRSGLSPQDTLTIGLIYIS